MLGIFVFLNYNEAMYIVNKSMIDSWMLSERTYEPKKSFYSYGMAFDPFGTVDYNKGTPVENPLFENQNIKTRKQMYKDYPGCSDI